MVKTSLSSAILFAFLSSVAAQGRGGGGGGGSPPPDPAIAFGHNDAIYVMNADGTNVTLVRSGTGSLLGYPLPVWSPDATRIAFSGDPIGQGPGIYVVQRDGSGARKVAAVPSVDTGRLAWSPVPAATGRHLIAYGANLGELHRELYVVDPDAGGAPVLLTATTGFWEHSVTWSPDATRVVVTDLMSGACDLLDLAVDGDNALFVAGRRSITLGVPGSPFEHATTAGVNWPDWSRDGSTVLLSASNMPGGSAFDLWKVPVSAPAQAVRITFASGGNERYGSWSPDDRRLVLWYSDRRNNGIYRLQADGTGLARLLAWGRNPDWRRNP